MDTASALALLQEEELARGKQYGNFARSSFKSGGIDK